MHAYIVCSHLVLWASGEGQIQIGNKEVYAREVWCINNYKQVLRLLIFGHSALTINFQWSSNFFFKLDKFINFWKFLNS